MEYTGIETVWWPEKHEATPRGLWIKKDQFAGKNPWVPIFQDPERFAIFRLAISRCLEHYAVKTYQNTAIPARCEVMKEVMLDTTLIPATALINAAPQSYELNERYVLWH